MSHLASDLYLIVHVLYLKCCLLDIRWWMMIDDGSIYTHVSEFMEQLV